jgi:hypothetical protein
MTSFIFGIAAFPASVLVHWKAGEKEPWCLATNMPDRKLVLQYYSG